MTNVKDFGAIGDGAVDDTKALQHAIEQGDGRLELPRGIYRLTRSLVVELKTYGPFSISGDGGRARLVMMGPGPAVRIVGTHDKTAEPKDFRTGVWERERLPTVSEIEILGGHEEADGLELDGTMQATISGVLIRRCRYGVHLVQRNRNVLLADSHIYHSRPNGIGVYFDGVNLHQTIITGCHISYCGHAGIKIARSEVRNLQITGSDIEYNFTVDQPDCADVWIDAREGTVREGTIASNTIQAKHSPGGANLRIEGPTLDDSRGAGLWTIAGNILQSQDISLLLRNCRGIVVSGNSFASSYERSILIERCRNVAIGANTFDKNPDYQGEVRDGVTIRESSGINLSGLVLENSQAGTPEQGGAIEVVDSNEITIHGCQVLDPKQRGIDLRNVRHADVSGCTVLDRRKEPVMIEAIRLIGEGGGNVVRGNLVNRGTRGALTFEERCGVATENVTVQD